MMLSRLMRRLRGATQRPSESQTLAQAIASLPGRHIEVAGADAMATWERLRAKADGWPIIVGGDAQLMQLARTRRATYRNTAATLARADRLRHPDSLHQLRRDEAATVPGPTDPPPQEGDWPDTTIPSTGPTLLRDTRNQPLARVHLLVLPTAEGATIPALLGWGGWNACPPPEHHVAALRAWQATHGAELVGLGADILELRVRQRPPTRAAALSLAHEHYAYCNDIIDQGSETFAPYAAPLMADDWWTFWWD